MYVCVCKAVTDTQIKQAINEGLSSQRELFKCLGVGGSCGKCNPDVKELLNDHSRNQTLMQNNANPSILAA
ncbi:MAG: (2Fe-2S)-binding protein [Methyloglobulus sp.]|nr:(2Fe-2S)-binding protein [Methyloglobulus sp.]